MKTAKILAFSGLIAMTLALLYGFMFGDFFKDGAQLLSNPWGVVSIVDLYVGFALFSGWIFYREKSRIKAVAWTILLLTLGFWAASLYLVISLKKSNGLGEKFWMGVKADVSNI